MGRRPVHHLCVVCRKGRRRKTRKYCSVKCSAIGRKFRADRLPCVWCGNDVTQTRAQIKKYCNRKCYGEQLREENRQKSLNQEINELKRKTTGGIRTCPAW